MKRILSLLVAMVMTLGCVGITAMAEETASVVAKIDTTEFTTLSAAIDAANAGDEIDLCADVEKIPTITKAITINGNDYHVTAKADEHQFGVINGTVTLKNLVYDNGTEAIRTDYGNYGDETNDYVNLDLVIEGCTFNNLTGYAIMGGQTTTKMLKSLTITKCTFNAGTECDNYMVYAQQVGALTITDCIFNGNGVTKGAIHTGDSLTTATVATISGGSISGVERGVQVANRVAGSNVSVSGVTFNGVTAAEGEKTGALYVYEYATTPVSATNNTFNECTNIVSTNNTTEGFVSTIITEFTGNTADDKEVVLEEDGTVTEKVSPVAKIGTTEYTSFDEAITAANAMTGDVTVEIYGKVEYTDSTANLTGAYDSISFVGKTEDAEISITRDGSGGYISGSTAGNDCTVNFTDLILSKPTGAYANDAGFMNVYFTVYRVGAVNYTNCVFPDGACAQGCDVKYNYCEFANQTSGEYSLWVYANTTTTVTNSKFTGVRGVKMYGEGASKTGNLVMSDTVFTESVTQKPAIVLTYGESVTLEGNTYPTKGVFELDLDGSPDGTTVTAGTTTNITCINDSGACGVLVDGKIYTTVAAAAAVATTGSTVTLLHNSTETVTLPEGVILDKNGYTAENVTVKVTAVAQIGDTTYATLAEAVAAAKDSKEIVVELLEDATLDITAWQTLAIGGEATEKITINGNGNTLTFNKKNSDWNNIATNNNATLILNNMTITDSGYNNGPWNRYDLNFACDVELNGVTSTKALAFKAGATLNDVEVNESGDNYAIWIQPNGQTVEIDGLTVNSAGRGIKIDNQYVDSAKKVNLSVSNSTFTTAKKAAILVKSPAGADIEATNVDITNVAADSTNLVWVDEDGASAFGTVTVTGANVAVEGGEENFSVAILSGDTVNGYYKDLHDAMVAAKSGETVSLLCDVDLSGAEWEPVSFAGKFNGNGYKIKNLTINKPGVSNTGFITSLNGAFENVTFENPTVTGGECTGVLAGRAGGSASYAKDIKVTGTIKVETTHSGYARAGVIVGGWAYGKYENITVDGLDKTVSYIKHTGGGDGRYVAGIVGHADDVDAYINCTVKNITISGGWLCGGIAGPGPSDGIATGCAVENIDMGADYSGGMFGWYYGAGTIENSSVKDVTFTDGSTNNGSIGGYSNNDKATVTNVTVENVKNADGLPLLSDAIEVTYADGTVQYFSDILDAVPRTTNYPIIEGATIKLLGDYTGSGIRFMENDMVLDLNGFTYTINSGAGSNGTETQCFQIRPEVTTKTIVKNGTIAVAPAAERSGNIYWVFNAYTNLDIENVKIDCTNLDTTTNGNYVVLSRATTNLTGSTSIVNFGDRGISIANTTDGNTNIDTTGKIEGTIDTDGTTTIKNGIFTYDVSEFCADGYTCVQNEDGTYGVQEKSEESTALNTKVFFLYNRTPMEAPAAIQEKYGEGNYYRVRLYAAIDGLDYSELGFKVAIDNGVNTPASAVFALENKVVYDTIKVTTDDGTTTLKPEQFNHTEDFNAKYLYALNVWVHENWGPETKLSVTPYAKDLNLKEFNGLVWGSDVIGTVQE